MKHETGACGISKTMEVLGGKWTILIVRDLLNGPRRFGELEQSLQGISPRTLAVRLKDLEAEGILERRCQEHAHPLYALTEKGQSLSSILEQMRNWGEYLVKTH